MREGALEVPDRIGLGVCDEHGFAGEGGSGAGAGFGPWGDPLEERASLFGEAGADELGQVAGVFQLHDDAAAGFVDGVDLLAKDAEDGVDIVTLGDVPEDLIADAEAAVFEEIV